jgi:hypothetical protein
MPLHRFRDMLFHVFYLPAVLSVLLAVDHAKLVGATPAPEGELGFVEHKYKMLLLTAGYELVFIYTGSGGYVFGLLKTLFAVVGFAAFTHYGIGRATDEAFISLLIAFAKTTAIYYTLGRFVCNFLLWKDAPLWTRLSSASLAMVELLEGVKGQDQMRVRGALEAMHGARPSGSTFYAAREMLLKPTPAQT